jgi:hypothetical protein
VSGEHAWYLTKTGHPLKFRLLSIHSVWNWSEDERNRDFSPTPNRLSAVVVQFEIQSDFDKA